MLFLLFLKGYTQGGVVDICVNQIDIEANIESKEYQFCDLELTILKTNEVKERKMESDHY